MAAEGLSEAQGARFKRLAWPYLPVLLRMALYLTRRDAEAEDLVQETMLKAMRFIDSYQDGTDIRAWLMTILRRTRIDMLRANRRHADEVSLDAAGDLHLASDAEPSPDRFDHRCQNPEELLDRFEDATVIEALKTLPEEIRWTLLLVDIEQLDQATAARVLDVPVGTIKSRASRGRHMLRDRLSVVAQQRGWVANSERGVP